ncbi:DUF4902 domain-containing protein [Burkholderia alba]|uniref:DUF4902 domain-containing protein n=1 Tax=Burkholderia alba TaxID=2683677 RepID=UPI002B060255|nr:DUF4902 domain-containing protein [Burkholderia alba]
MPEHRHDDSIRLTLSEFRALRFRRYLCLQDLDLLRELWREGIPAVNAGFYELICEEHRPAASIGCTWHVCAGRYDIRIPKEDVSFNMMLLDTYGNEYGMGCSRLLIHDWLCSGARERDIQSAVLKETGIYRHN